jgi:hypothetical protein
LFLSWFTFDTERPPEDVTALLGEPGQRWLTAIGPFMGDTATLDVYNSTGGVFDSEQPPVNPAEKVGTMTVEWSDCGNAVLSYELTEPVVSGSMDLVRVVPRDCS